MRSRFACACAAGILLAASMNLLVLDYLEHINHDAGVAQSVPTTISNSGRFLTASKVLGDGLEGSNGVFPTGSDISSVSSALKRNVLVICPTIPVSVKGGDVRAVQAVRHLAEAGHAVDLLYWRDFATDSGINYDDAPDLERLRRAGVSTVHGPCEKLSECGVFTSWYDTVLFWVWPHIEWLDMVADAVTHIKSNNGRTAIMAAVDDAGLAAKMLRGGLTNHHLSVEDVENFTLAMVPTDFGYPQQQSLATDADFDREVLEYAKVIIHQEAMIYSAADVLLGINSETANYLERIAPSKPVHMLRFKSPIEPAKTDNLKPFHLRKDYVFFGYDSPANQRRMDWFIREVIPHIPHEYKLHIAGAINVAGLCFCQSGLLPCSSSHENIVCHGVLSESDLDELVEGSRVAINPSIEPSGVSTKTCRAMAFGTPVVVTDQDGTFSEGRRSVGAKRCPMGNTTALCFAQYIKALLSDEQLWHSASMAAPSFIEKHYGPMTYEADWSSILSVISSQKIEVVIQDTTSTNDGSLALVNWHIAQILSAAEEVRVTVIADKFSPAIPGVRHIPQAKSPFQADAVIQQHWPPTFDRLPTKFCGHGCRIIKVLPWEFGYLPEEWVPALQESTDSLWGYSEYVRHVYSRSGVSPSRSAVVHPAIDCSELDQLSLLSKKEHDTVVFIFSGGFLPRKGIDIILEEWNNVFCLDDSSENVKLILHTNYEHGYDEEAVSRMVHIIENCGNIDWKRGEWMEREQHLDMLRSSDIYMAPYRSEGFGLPIVEAMRLGLSVIVTAGDSASKDYIPTSLDPASHRVFPVRATESQCIFPPCTSNEVCVNGCLKLVKPPTLFEVDRADLRDQMRKAYSHISANRVRTDKTNKEAFPAASSFCWSHLRDEYVSGITDVLESPMQRNNLPRLERPSLQSAYKVTLAGLIRDGSDVSTLTSGFLADLNCAFDVSIHVVVAFGKAELEDAFSLARMKWHPSSDCAPLRIEYEPDHVANLSNRIDRLSALRDFQREMVASTLGGDVIVLADLDISEMPPAQKIMSEAFNMVRNEKTPDILCSAGRTSGGRYYDTYATVLLPDTFVYPLAMRLNEEPWEGEDESFILPINAPGLLHWFEEEGRSRVKNFEDYTVPVRSCFGGLALYRSSAFFDNRCSYAHDNPENEKYSGKNDMRPCEHVVFHNCLANVNPNIDIAVQPDMQPLYEYNLNNVEGGEDEEEGNLVARGLLSNHTKTSKSSKKSKRSKRTKKKTKKGKLFHRRAEDEDFTNKFLDLQRPYHLRPSYNYRDLLSNHTKTSKSSKKSKSSKRAKKKMTKKGKLFHRRAEEETSADESLDLLQPYRLRPFYHYRDLMSNHTKTGKSSKNSKSSKKAKKHTKKGKLFKV